ncbi:hypothetical protein CMV_013953 [Castanea mollissima]|uniref:Uncharacterized protein n=1 Tax=Castanea mollissima TaxID=60419 RepID=A0A8J4VUZ8_9ROSI|nr:hypothetical protein CMV_013953 [Castanea mollissima]
MIRVKARQILMRRIRMQIIQRNPREAGANARRMGAEGCCPANIYFLSFSQVLDPVLFVRTFGLKMTSCIDQS